jgi:hypothetical protein
LAPTYGCSEGVSLGAGKGVNLEVVPLGASQAPYFDIAAKAEADYRFYALYDKISREDILAHAYAQCRSNKGRACNVLDYFHAPFDGAGSLPRAAGRK